METRLVEVGAGDNPFNPSPADSQNSQQSGQGSYSKEKSATYGYRHADWEQYV